MYGKESKSQVGNVWEFQKDGAFVVEYRGGHKLAGEYRRYPVERDSPQWIDIETTEDKPAFGGGGPRPGIVAVKGDRLELCVSGGGKSRPEKFASEAGSRYILYLMQRIAEPAAK
jgi:uncharacterized protein (TIGR03067 family)